MGAGRKAIDQVAAGLYAIAVVRSVAARHRARRTKARQWRIRNNIDFDQP